MRRVLVRGAALLLVAVLAGPAGADEKATDPVKLLRTLEFLQDSIAGGTVDSDDARRRMIDLVGKRFLALNADAWRDDRNFEAALLYVLNGGNAAVLVRLPQAEGDPKRADLVAAVSAYAAGSQSDAKRLWMGIDIDALPVGLAGPAALVKANLLMDTDPKEALRFADIARLESPGTLVEEAATRRGIEVAASLGDAERFEFFATRYAMRFPRSMYGAAFRKRFTESYLAVVSKDRNDTGPHLDTILAPLSLEDRREIYLEVARLAVIEARMTMAQKAADSAAALSAPGTLEMQRAELYRTAAGAILGSPDVSVEKLAAVPPDAMSQGDRELLSAVRSVVGEIQRWPATPVGPPVPGKGTAAIDTDGGTQVDTIVSRASEVMTSAGKTLALAETGDGQ